MNKFKNEFRKIKNIIAKIILAALLTRGLIILDWITRDIHFQAGFGMRDNIFEGDHTLLFIAIYSGIVRIPFKNKIKVY